MANRRKYLDKSSKARLADRHRMTRIARRSDLDDSRAHCKSIFTSGLFLTGRPSRFSSRIAFLITFIRLSSALARRLDSPMVTRPDLRSAKICDQASSIRSSQTECRSSPRLAKIKSSARALQSNSAADLGESNKLFLRVRGHVSRPRFSAAVKAD